ncbi:Mitochondrial 2-oxodicarboxylate carrier [Pseudolycoriella hygida]|uniref:Mitochondrial 2-oxodicarboxylate carrier n=1 Tax=Pseudolycoriella hygida TaxID=35572 RepID=A0A9Q0MRW7_9DIPT|nr:Mitochondrial 2-oxodicarboxylate carrier [Pseudolycoriella hygida]
MSTNANAKPSVMKQAAMQITAGGSAGFIEVCLMHPLDVVKTRLQLQVKKPVAGSKTVYYNGVFDCFSKIARQEGVLAVYKGILPPILAETPKRATKFVCFEQYKTSLQRALGFDKATPFIYSLAGLGSGVTEAIVVNPFEVVKVSLQANTGKATSTWTVAKEIINRGGIGLNGLNKGLTSTIGRNGTWNLIYFGFYHSVKDIIPQCQSPTADFFRKTGIGFASGTIASIANIPFDVAKSRIQGPQPIVGEVKYKTCMKTIVTVAKEEGFGALYKGLVPKVMRLGPGGAIMLIAYEYVYEFLQHRFP